jgi:hypothetical protein
VQQRPRKCIPESRPSDAVRQLCEFGIEVGICEARMDERLETIVEAGAGESEAVVKLQTVRR